MVCHQRRVTNAECDAVHHTDRPTTGDGVEAFRRRQRQTTCPAAPPLINTPSSAPFPVATITAVGTASPIAHGQATMSTATAAANARTAGAGMPTAPAAMNQPKKVTNAIE